MAEGEERAERILGAWWKRNGNACHAQKQAGEVEMWSLFMFVCTDMYRELIESQFYARTLGFL